MVEAQNGFGGYFTAIHIPKWEKSYKAGYAQQALHAGQAFSSYFSQSSAEVQNLTLQLEQEWLNTFLVSPRPPPVHLSSSPAFVAQIAQLVQYMASPTHQAEWRSIWNVIDGINARNRTHGGHASSSSTARFSSFVPLQSQRHVPVSDWHQVRASDRWGVDTASQSGAHRNHEETSADHDEHVFPADHDNALFPVTLGEASHLRYSASSSSNKQSSKRVRLLEPDGETSAKSATAQVDVDATAAASRANAVGHPSHQLVKHRRVWADVTIIGPAETARPLAPLNKRQDENGALLIDDDPDDLKNSHGGVTKQYQSLRDSKSCAPARNLLIDQTKTHEPGTMLGPIEDGEDSSTGAQLHTHPSALSSSGHHDRPSTKEAGAPAPSNARPGDGNESEEPGPSSVRPVPKHTHKSSDGQGSTIKPDEALERRLEAARQAIDRKKAEKLMKRRQQEQSE